MLPIADLVSDKACSQPTVCSEKVSDERFVSFCRVEGLHELLCIWLSPYNASNENAGDEKAPNKANERSDGKDKVALTSSKIADLSRATN